MHHALNPIRLVLALLAFIGWTLLLTVTASYWLPSLILSGLPFLP